jgi:hypothetical protein
MSTKQLAIEIIRRLPDEASVADVFAGLTAGLRPDDWSADELSEDEWRQLVVHSLAAELNDPREDICTLEDGTPIDEPV